MVIAETINQVRENIREYKKDDKRIALIPTMGYLHEGHLSLIHIARTKADIVAVSIYVNPAQFGPGEDLDSYPRDTEEDMAKLKNHGTDFVFYPSDLNMYPSPFNTYVNVEKLTSHLCGASRPAHFKGVATIVAKLFNIIQPDVAVFGEKDYQQLAVIRQMTRDLNWPIEIIGGPVIREKDGLALSSRNKYLSGEERQQAPVLYKTMNFASERYVDGEEDPAVLKKELEPFTAKFPLAKQDYIEFVDRNTLEIKTRLDDNTRIILAFYLGKTRLIDNMDLNPGTA